jgi:hypothetical protein
MFCQPNFYFEGTNKFYNYRDSKLKQPGIFSVLLYLHMKEVSLVYPHQLFEDNPCIAKGRDVFLLEDELYFRQYPFHKKKILLHRASMKFYEHFLKTQHLRVLYIHALMTSIRSRIFFHTLKLKVLLQCIIAIPQIICWNDV